MGALTVTTPVRTAVDLACQLRSAEALAALDAFLRMQLITSAEAAALLPRFVGRRGVVQARRLIALADGRAESPGESWTRMRVVDAGMPVPELQIAVYEDDVEIARLDMGYRAVRVGLEFDGVAHHSSPRQRAHDEARRERLERLGWRLIVVRKEDLTRERRDVWLDELRRILRP
jgi:hypothetical protein